MSDKAMELVRKIARGIRYRELTELVGAQITFSDRFSIPNESTAFVRQSFEDCVFAGPEQNILDGQIAKYGILDLRFAAPASLIERQFESGVALLRRLGYAGNIDGMPDGDEDSDDDIEFLRNACLEMLWEGIATGETHVMLFLKSESPSAEYRTVKEKMRMLRDPSLLKFPMTFLVVDACATNATSVWMHKHFYL